MGQTAALELLIGGAGSQVVHLAMTAFGDPSRKIFKFRETGGRGNPAEIEAGFAGKSRQCAA